MNKNYIEIFEKMNKNDKTQQKCSNFNQNINNIEIISVRLKQYFYIHRKH